MPQVNPIIKRGLQDKALALILEGKGSTALSKELGVSRKASESYCRLLSKGTERVQNGSPIKGAVRLEISQENALSELSKQLEQYTENYEAALRAGDGKAAYAWSARRVELLEKMIRVTGLYDAQAGAQGETIRIIFEDVKAGPDGAGRSKRDELEVDLSRTPKMER